MIFMDICHPVSSNGKLLGTVYGGLVRWEIIHGGFLIAVFDYRRILYIYSKK